MEQLDKFLDELNQGQTLLIDHQTLMAQLKSRKPLQILDIRRDEAFKKGHIEGAVQWDWSKAGDLIGSPHMSKDKPVIVACYTGQSSMQVATLLKLAGYDAYSLLDGMAAWPDNLTREK